MEAKRIWESTLMWLVINFIIIIIFLGSLWIKINVIMADNFIDQPLPVIRIQGRFWWDYWYSPASSEIIYTLTIKLQEETFAVFLSPYS